MWWDKFISDKAQKLKYAIPSDVLDGLTVRWAFFDKSFRIDGKAIDNEEFLKWAKDFDKVSHKDQVKDNMYPFEVLIMELGVEILKNTENFLSAVPDKAEQKIKDEIMRAHLIDLISQRLSPTSISEKLGFSDTGNFNRACKRLTGMTPGELISAREQEASYPGSDLEIKKID